MSHTWGFAMYCLCHHVHQHEPKTNIHKESGDSWSHHRQMGLHSGALMLCAAPVGINALQEDTLP